MKASAVCTVLNVADSTLRKYAHDYAGYLTDSAAGGAGKHREYTDHDVRVLKLVNDMKLAKQSGDDIEVTLRSLQDSGWERLPALDEGSSAIIPRPAAMVAANADKSVMLREIEILHEQMDAMKADSKAERDERDARIIDLERKLSRAETLLELYKSGDLRPKDE